MFQLHFSNTRNLYTSNYVTCTHNTAHTRGEGEKGDHNSKNTTLTNSVTWQRLGSLAEHPGDSDGEVLLGDSAARQQDWCYWWFEDDFWLLLGIVYCVVAQLPLAVRPKQVLAGKCLLAAGSRLLLYIFARCVQACSISRAMRARYIGEAHTVAAAAMPRPVRRSLIWLPNSLASAVVQAVAARPIRQGTRALSLTEE